MNEKDLVFMRINIGKLAASKLDLLKLFPGINIIDAISENNIEYTRLILTNRDANIVQRSDGIIVNSRILKCQKLEYDPNYLLTVNKKKKKPNETFVENCVQRSSNLPSLSARFGEKTIETIKPNHYNNRFNGNLPKKEKKVQTRSVDTSDLLNEVRNSTDALSNYRFTINLFGPCAMDTEFWSKELNKLPIELKKEIEPLWLSMYSIPEMKIINGHYCLDNTQIQNAISKQPVAKDNVLYRVFHQISNDEDLNSFLLKLLVEFGPKKTNECVIKGLLMQLPNNGSFPKDLKSFETYVQSYHRIGFVIANSVFKLNKRIEKVPIVIKESQIVGVNPNSTLPQAENTPTTSVETPTPSTSNRMPLNQFFYDKVIPAAETVAAPTVELESRSIARDMARPISATKVKSVSCKSKPEVVHVPPMPSNNISRPVGLVQPMSHLAADITAMSSNDSTIAEETQIITSTATTEDDLDELINLADLLISDDENENDTDINDLNTGYGSASPTDYNRPNIGANSFTSEHPSPTVAQQRQMQSNAAENTQTNRMACDMVDVNNSSKTQLRRPVTKAKILSRVK